ncbi:hypothetical protein KIH39_08250 [Telmatocola sphagniphila]|uniref:histidine kinase n=1 Tax=Telmatocola sphagniphila TaxID=1123043 RepID=A0A8E6B8L5_9BACT|nr:ATP-binding protein [Telmatocola sphagniphila]QVL33882.1 hypothetical protein KIH39_08250 [Telmatocola sphagniphila]
MATPPAPSDWPATSGSSPFFSSSLGHLTGGIAHNFNNYLTTILGNAELAAMVPQQDRQTQEYLGQIQVAAQQAADLCQKLLIYSGNSLYRSTPNSINALLESLRRPLEALMEGRATLLLMLGVDLPRIDCDPELFKQAVTQLVLNAVEAQDGPPSKILLLSGRRRFKRADLDSFIHGRTLPEEVYVTLEVIDTGRGISAAEIGRIFEPFYSTKLTGRGLGLSIVLGFMHRLGGAISVKSEPNQGSTFRLLFPAIPTSKA